jgi:hypothetical protein
MSSILIAASFKKGKKMKVTLAQFIDKIEVCTGCIIDVIIAFSDRRGRIKKILSPRMVFEYSDFDKEYKMLFKDPNKPLWSVEDLKDTKSDYIMEAIYDISDTVGKSIILNITPANVKKFHGIQRGTKRGLVDDVVVSSDCDLSLILEYLGMDKDLSYHQCIVAISKKSWEDIYKISARILEMSFERQR